MAGISFDPVADVYDATRALPAPLMAQVVDALAEILGRDGPSLEVGVGTGRFAVPLREKGVRVIGVDIASQMLARARAKGARDLVQATAMRLPFRDRTFRAGVAIHMLHLVASWRDVLREIARVTNGPFVTLRESIQTRPVGGEAPPAGAGPGDAYHPIRRYHELAEARGYTYEHPGVRPQDLLALVRPTLRLPVGAHTEILPGTTLLAAVATKSYSSQWDVPDGVHAAVMDALSRELEGGSFERTTDVDIVGWAASDLRAV